MDFISGLPKSHHYDTIFVVVDRFTKFAHFFPLRHPYTALTVAELFVKEVVRLHGFPRSIVSDRDRLFLSNFWKEIFRAAGTQLCYSSSYHPQSDGQTEVVNRSLETYLRCFCSEQPSTWSKWLCWAEYWFNTNFNRSTGMTPFKALYGQEPPTLYRFQEPLSAVEAVNVQIQNRNVILDELRRNLLHSQQHMKQYADRKRRNVHFQVGDSVFLRLQPYRHRSLATRPNEKLSPRFYGPFPVIERIGPVAYRLQLPPGAQLHPVFHISQLKKSLSPSVHPQPLPSMLSADMELQVTPQAVLQHRRMTDGRLELLIQWVSLPASDSTWEDYDVIHRQFPAFQLEDKSVLIGGVMMSMGRLSLTIGSGPRQSSKGIACQKYE